MSSISDVTAYGMLDSSTQDKWGTECRLLIVDDDSTFSALCTRYLRRLKNADIRVDQAEDGQSAMKKYSEASYDCMIVDYRLPDMLGTDLLIKLRQNAQQAVLAPAIVMTAYGGESVAIDAVRAEAVDYMCKSDVTRASLILAIENAQSKGELRRAVHERNERLQIAHDALIRKTEENTRFYHTVSHEVKTPLTSIQEFTELLRDEVVGALNDKQQELLRYSSESCQQIACHFNAMLEITRFDTDKVVLDQSAHAPHDLINRCVLGASGVARDKGVNLTADIEPAMPLIFVDANRLAQVLSNIINNAIKFTENGGRVHVIGSHCTEKKVCMISISDSGIGIDEAYLERIFDRLFQVNACEARESETNGLGLGLAIARENIKRLGGEISVSSIPDEGSCFHVSLPLTTKAA